MKEQSDQDKQYNEAKQQVGQAVDHVFGAGTSNMVSGRANQALGVAEIEVGHVAGDRATEFDGVKHAVRGTAERAQGQVEHDLAAMRAQIEKEVAALKTKISNLRAEYNTATDEARANVQAKIDDAKASLQATQARIRTALDEAKEQTDAKVESLQQQAAQARGEARTKIEDLIDEVQYENKQYVEYLNKALADNTLVLR